MADEFGFGQIAASALEFAGGLMANNRQSSNIKKSAKYNRWAALQQQGFAAEQAATARQFEQYEAQQQRAFEGMWAQRQMDFQDAANQKAMDFSERMSSTAHQREIADLRAAGLNPILSGTGGMGSSTPVGVSSAGSMARGSKASGASASGSSGGGIGSAGAVNPMSGVIASALAIKRSEAEIDVLKATAEEKRAYAGKAGEDINLSKLLQSTEAERVNLIKAQVADYTESAAFKEWQRRSKGPVEIEQLKTQIAELGSRILVQAAQGANYNALTARTGEETAQLQTMRFFRKKIVDLEQSDLGGYMKDVPIDLVKGFLLNFLPRNLQ